MGEATYSRAMGDETAEIRGFLRENGLPEEGVEAMGDRVIVGRSGGRIVGTAGVEVLGRVGLLRSVAVGEGWRGRGLGRELCARVINLARLEGAERVYLLTMTAEGFFGKLGFGRVGRGDVPEEIAGTGEFRSICPVSAVCMMRTIGGEAIHATGELLRLRPDVPGSRMWAVALERTMLTYFEVAARCCFPAHSHESEQITMVLSGELYFEVGGEVRCVKSGEVIALPANVPHAVFTREVGATAVDAWSPVMGKYQKHERG